MCEYQYAASATDIFNLIFRGARRHWYCFYSVFRVRHPSILDLIDQWHCGDRSNQGGKQTTRCVTMMKNNLRSVEKTGKSVNSPNDFHVAKHDTKIEAWHFHHCFLQNIVDSEEEEDPTTQQGELHWL